MSILGENHTVPEFGSIFLVLIGQFLIQAFFQELNQMNSKVLGKSSVLITSGFYWLSAFLSLSFVSSFNYTLGFKWCIVTCFDQTDSSKDAGIMTQLSEEHQRSAQCARH